MMMRRGFAGLVLAGLLVACGQANLSAPEEAAMGGRAEGYAVSDSVTAPPPAAAPAPPMDADMSAGEAQRAPTQSAGAPGQGTGTPQGPAPVLYLAYSYQMGLEVPAARLSGVMDAHVKACQDAGPRLCQLIGSNRSGDPDAYMNGYVSLRGEPTWLRSFTNGVAAQVDEAGGRVKSQTTNTEDLTRQIVDTEARLRASRALRDRLQRLLESRPGRLADLLEVERELARVQGEIDATESNLAVMRTRVSMSELTLSYESAPQSLRSDTFEPLKNAFANFLRWIVVGLAAIVTLVAVLLPWALVLGLFGWLALKWRRRNGGRFWRRKASAPPPSQASDETSPG